MDSHGVGVERAGRLAGRPAISRRRVVRPGTCGVVLASLVSAVLWAPAAAASAVVPAPSVVELRQLQAQGVVNIIVRRSPGLSSAERSQLRSSADVRFAAGLSIRDTEVDRASPGHLAAALAKLNADSSVIYAEPDAPVHAASAPNDPGFGSQWALQNAGQTLLVGGASYAGTTGDDIGALSAWQRTLGQGAAVAVIDSGIEFGAPDLANQTVAGYDFVAGTPDPQDLNGHGTHVSGVIAAARNNGIGVSGLAPAAKLMPLRVLDANGDGTDANVAAAFNYAGTHGVRVVNASLDSTTPSQTQADAILANPQTLYVVAAGNSATNNDTTPHYPCNIPAANIICVGASDQNDQPARFSDYGASTVNLFAPGVNVLSTWLNGTTGTGCSTVVPCPQYSYADGTSMAAPLVAATLALMLSENPSLTAAQLKSDLLSSVHTVAALGGKSATSGRLDAARAVTAAAPPSPLATPPAAAPAPTPAPIQVATPTQTPTPTQAPTPIPAPGPVQALTPTQTGAPRPVAAATAVALSWSQVALRPSIATRCPRPSHQCRPRAAKLSFTLSQAAKINITLARTVHGRIRTIAIATVSKSAGINSYMLHQRFAGHDLARGSYQVAAQAQTGQQHSTVFHATLQVLRS